MIYRYQAVFIGILFGILAFVLYVRVVPEDSIHDTPSSKNLIRRDKPVSLSKKNDVPKIPQKEEIIEGLKEKAKTAEKFESDFVQLAEAKINPVQTAATTRIRDPSIYCPKMMKKYHIVPGSSWGSTTMEQQRQWTTLKCDQYVGSKITDTLQEQEESAEKSIIDKKLASHTSLPPIHDESQRENDKDGEEATEVGMPSIPKSHRQWCRSAREKYKVKPMKSWGQLPANMIEDWKNKHCDLVFTANRMGKRPISSCPNTNSSVSITNEGHSNMSPSLPLIAIMAATTTRKVSNPSTANLALFTLLLPSLMRSLDCGFRYEYVLGYDLGDSFYDSEAGLKDVKKWFYKNIRQPMKKNGIEVKLRLVKVNNSMKKPGPVFLEMARAAYVAGADYLFRINDDTELTTPWAKIFVETLLSMGVPYGVVGPNCDQGNQKILTHDFVHRSHMQIFEMNYYPPQLSDWWMDDWISWVYGQTRTFKARGTSVIHHTGAHGQRYQVDPSHEHLLGNLVQQGRQKIRQYMLKQQVSEDVLKRFDQDTAVPGFTHRDVPNSVKEKLVSKIKA